MKELLQKYFPKNKRIRMFILMLLDIYTVWLASFMGLFIRFDMNINKIPTSYSRAAYDYLPIYIVSTLIIFFFCRMYSTMWSVAGIQEVLHIIGACGLSSLIQLAGMMMLERHVPRSYFLISFAALSGVEILIRLSYRIMMTLSASNAEKSQLRIMIAGAGSSGSVILKE